MEEPEHIEEKRFPIGGPHGPHWEWCDRVLMLCGLDPEQRRRVVWFRIEAGATEAAALTTRMLIDVPGGK